jgi:hypothetical protein
MAPAIGKLAVRRAQVVTCARTLLKQVVPPFTLRYDQTAATNLQNIDVMHGRWEGNGLRQPDDLTAIASEYRGS